MLKDVKDVLKDGQGYFTYLYKLKKQQKISFDEIALDEEKYLQLWWREGIGQGLLAWLFEIPLQKVTATHTQKLLINSKELDYKEKNIFLELNRVTLNSLDAYFSSDKIVQILFFSNKGLYTYLKEANNSIPFNLYFLNREMFYQLWWKESISDKEIGELVNMSERRIREVRTKEWLVTAPYLLEKDKGIDHIKNEVIFNR